MIYSSLTLMTATLVASTEAFSMLYPAMAAAPNGPPATKAATMTASSPLFSTFSREESSTSMPVAEDKMPFYALGLNLAMQAGGEGFKELLSQDELEIALEAFCTNMRRSNGEQQQQYADSRTILTTYGEELNRVLKERSGRIAGRIKQDGQFFVDSYLSSYPSAIRTASGLVYHETTVGTGASPTIMNAVEVHYHGTLTDGTVFDSSVDRGQPITFPLNGVIPGWTEGLQFMREGGMLAMITLFVLLVKIFYSSLTVSSLLFSRLRQGHVCCSVRLGVR
jgi:FKBP-type peptidyl-prolyl cis-trans isomerase